MSEMSNELRDITLRQAPPAILEAFRRVNGWARASTSIRDKISADELLTFVAQLMLDNQSMAGELGDLRWQLGVEDDLDDEDEAS